MIRHLVCTLLHSSVLKCRHVEIWDHSLAEKNEFLSLKLHMNIKYFYIWKDQALTLMPVKDHNRRTSPIMIYRKEREKIDKKIPAHSEET